MLRPERIRLGDADGARASGVVAEAQYFGAFTRVHVSTPAGTLLQADLPEGADAACPRPADTVHLHWDERRRASAREPPSAERPLTRPSSVHSAPPPPPSPACRRRGVATCCYTRRGLLLLALLAPALLWFGVVYLGSLFALLANAFFGLDDFTGQVVREFTLKNFIELADAGQRRRRDAHASRWRCASRWPAPCSASRSPTTWRAMRAARRRRCSTSR